MMRGKTGKQGKTYFPPKSPARHMGGWGRGKRGNTLGGSPFPLFPSNDQVSGSPLSALGPCLAPMVGADD